MYAARRSEGNFCPHCGGDLSYQGEETQLPVGSVLTGNEHSYLLGAARGQGGFGVTYVALDQESQKRVVIKEYFPLRCALRGADNRVMAKSGRESEFMQGFDNFLKEAQRLAGIRPLPSVVQVWGCFEANGTAYLVMEYLDGVPLHRVVAQREGPIPVQELLPKFPALMADLESLHRQGVLHRDISPDNILWMSDDTLKIIDFGSARSMEGDRSMTVMLKQGFAPVEQYLTRGQGPWTDVYALSATIYYALTGEVPPTAVDRLEKDTLKAPTSLGVALTPEEEQALMAGLAIQPKARLQSVAELSKALCPPSAPVPPVPDPVPPVPEPRPRPWLPWIGAGIAALILLILILALSGGIKILT